MSSRDNNLRRHSVLLYMQALAQRPLSLQAAFALSVFVHVSVFFLLALASSFFCSSLQAPAPLLLEFAFVPGPQALKTQAATTLPFAAPTPALASPPKEARSSASPLQAQTNFSSASHEESTGSLEHTAPESFHEAQSLAALAPTPRVSYSTSPLAPAKLRIAHNVARKLERETAKLSAKALFFAQKDTSVRFNLGDEFFTAKVKHSRASTATGLDEAEIVITTEQNGQQWQTRMRMQRLAFSHFAQFVDDWDPRVAIHDDQLDGRFHTNSTFTVSSGKGVQPKFQGKVTTAAFDVRQNEQWGVMSDKEIFQAGLETGAREIRMPNLAVTFFSTASLADSLYHRIEEETWLTFHADGAYSWRTAKQEQPQRRALPREPFLIVGGKKAALHVRGVVAGKVLVQSERKIVIEDDLTYARSPESDSRSEDYLGLVSRNDVLIAPPQITGPGDLRIYAAILARGKFEVTHLYGGEKAALHLYGSLSAGSLSATEPRYATRVRFDKRLEQRRPPYFPMTDRYEIIDWLPEWRMLTPGSGKK